MDIKMFYVQERVQAKDIYFKQISIIAAMIIAFNIVPIPGFWLKKIQRNITIKLVKKVIKPIE